MAGTPPVYTPSSAATDNAAYANIVKTAPIGAESAEKLEALIPESERGYLANFGCKIQSQNGEDGILYYIFSKIGTTNKKCIEISGGDGVECNSANLMLNHGFTGLIFESDEKWVQIGLDYYKTQRKLDCITFVNGWITKENIVEILTQIPNFAGDIDLLTMDIDGVDYWILKEIMDSGVIRSRVIVVEYQDIIGPSKALTVPYDPAFHCVNYDCYGGPNFCGASLRAFMKLLEKDYAFVGCEELGFNGFFLHKNELDKGIAEMTDIAACFEHPKVRFGMTQRFPRTAHLPWVDVAATE